MTDPAQIDAEIRRSLMPEGLLEALPDQSAADLLAYLLTLKG